MCSCVLVPIDGYNVPAFDASYVWYDATQQMLELSAIGAELESRQEQLQKELDALKAEARAQEATWKGLERRNVRD